VQKIQKDPEALVQFFKTNDRLIGAMIRNRILRIYPHKPKKPLFDDDAQQAGRLALWEAMKRYNPKKAYDEMGKLASFGTYAYSWARNELNKYFYPAKAVKRGGTGVIAGEPPKSLHDVVYKEGDKEITLGDVTGEAPTTMGPEEVTIESMEAKAVKRALKKLQGMLTGTPKKIVAGLIAGKSKAEMARKLGISRAAVTMALQKKVEPHWAEVKRMIQQPGKAALKSLVKAVLTHELLKAFDGVPVTPKTITRAGESLLKSLDGRVRYRPRFVFKKAR
jgi:RNA polymerase sigma factor (sigma-70 family)